MPSSGPIQQQPQGLLGFLQLKNAGRNPAILPDTLQPQLDLTSWYLETAAQTAVGTNPLAAGPGPGGFIGFNTPAIVVPQNQWWYLASYSVRVILFGATTDGMYDFAPGVRWDPAWTDPPGAYGCLGRSNNSRLNSAANDAVIWTQSDRAYWLPPGAELGFCYGFYFLGTTCTVTGYARYVPLLI